MTYHRFLLAAATAFLLVVASLSKEMVSAQDTATYVAAIRPPEMQKKNEDQGGHGGSGDCDGRDLRGGGRGGRDGRGGGRSRGRGRGRGGGRGRD